ncbi:RDD family protein [Yinghuangia seranimata]|uniref:RDD family protein n=1 Tax=Yinghuangia seranimata TaxID=408067 RepID=UPI00248CFF53|nr:RDD family protein [Yinghuangia seranimata]MDI2132360.1 RDD family protein [Yinghuangia seranimata]
MDRKQTAKKAAGRPPAKRAQTPPRPAAERTVPRQAPQADEDDFGYRGKRLGLPEDGPGSMAGTGRRLIALLVDWLLCYVIALAFIGRGDLNAAGTSFGTLAVFAAENMLLLSTLGYTVGKRLMGLRVISVTQPHLTPLAVVLRTLLLCMVVPAAVYDRDGRGLHDKAVGTAVVAA